MTKLGELRAFLGLFALSHLACRRSIGSIPFQGYISLPMPPLRTVLEMRRISFSSSGINISSSPSREMPEMALALTPPPTISEGGLATDVTVDVQGKASVAAVVNPHAALRWQPRAHAPLVVVRQRKHQPEADAVHAWLGAQPLDEDDARA